MHEIQVTLRGNVATDPKHFTFDDGTSLTKFRLASTPRWFDRGRQEWVNGGTTYADVNCRRTMATNAAASIRKGQPVVVTGTLKERFWDVDGRTGQTIAVDAVTLGHDLSYGTAEFVRIRRAERVSTVEDRSADHLAYADAEEMAEREPVDVSGYPVLGDGPDGAGDDVLGGRPGTADQARDLDLSVA